MAEATAVEPRIRQEVNRWMGTPHVLGGVSAAGMDCSAFVQRVFADAFLVDLPRTTEEQVEAGRRVNQSELRAGDLVFFQPPTKTNHVGIYLNGGEFAHVSSTNGVSISDIDEPYWRTSYWTSRRILGDGVHAETRERSLRQTAVRPVVDVPQDGPRRIGW